MMEISPSKRQHSEGYVQSEENIESEASNHSLEIKIYKARSSSFSKVWGKLISHIELLEQSPFNVSVLELVDFVKLLVMEVELVDIEGMRNTKSKLLVEVIERIVQFKQEVQALKVLEWLLSKQAYETKISHIQQLAFYSDEDVSIHRAEESVRRQTIHVRQTHDAFGEVERTVTVQRLKMGTREYALKSDWRVFSCASALKSQVQVDCTRLHNWFELSGRDPPHVLQVNAAQVVRRTPTTLCTKSLTPFHDGHRLNEFLGRTPLLTERQKLGIADQMVDAVLCLHDGGLVHGDVKPQNFLCYGVDYFSLTLIDMDSLSRDRDTTSIDSTVLYSMEDWYPVPSYEADVWALGLSLYALVSHQKIMQNWGYGEYRKRDQQLPQYVDGYGALDEVLRLCLSRTNQHLSVISGMIKARLR